MYSLVSISQNKDCTKFKEGTFYYPQIPDYGYSVREKNIQKSYVKSKDMWVTWNIKWTSDCSFELTFKEADKNDNTFTLDDKIIVTITSTDNDCYSFASIFFNKTNLKGREMPVGQMCIKKN